MAEPDGAQTLDLTAVQISPRSEGVNTLDLMTAEVDYAAPVARAEMAVRELEQKRGQKQKPNNVCQCGSGKKYKKCCGYALPQQKLNPYEMTVVGKAWNADGTVRNDALTVCMKVTGELVQMPLNQLARQEGHAKAVQEANAARARGEGPEWRLPVDAMNRLPAIKPTS